jgi:hypothetical protein
VIVSCRNSNENLTERQAGTYRSSRERNILDMAVSAIFKVAQYSESNVMHFLFILLIIKGLYMFQALLAHPQEALHKRHLVLLCACYVSWLH